MQPMLIIFAMIASIAAGNSATHVTDVSVLSSPVSQHSAQTAMAFEDLGPAIQLVVLACKRPLALNALLTNLHSVGESGGYEGHSVPLLISIDVPRGKLAPPADVVGLANGFGWAHGEKTVKVQAQHQGIIGQWLNLRTTASNPWMAVLEDDLALSPCFYSYLLRARQVFGHREDVAGFTLQKHGPCLTEGDFCAVRDVPMDRPYLVRCVGSWGFMPTPSSWAQFIDWQAAHNMTKPTASLPRQLVHHKWYEEFVANDKLDSFWTIWHLAYTHAVGKATLVAELPEPLALPHGQQPSEHGNEADRPGMVTSLRQEENPVRVPALNKIRFPTPARRPSLGQLALNLAQTTLEMEMEASRHLKAKANALKDARVRDDSEFRSQRHLKSEASTAWHKADTFAATAGRGADKDSTSAPVQEMRMRGVSSTASALRAEVKVVTPSAPSTLASEAEASGCCVADPDTFQAGGNQTCVSACKPGENCCGPCGCPGCPHHAEWQVIEGICSMPATMHARLPTVRELGLCTQCDEIRDPTAAFWSATPVAYDYDGRRMAWPPAPNSTRMPSLVVSLELAAKRSRRRLVLEATSHYDHAARASHPISGHEGRVALFSGRDSKSVVRSVRSSSEGRAGSRGSSGGSGASAMIRHASRRPELAPLPGRHGVLLAGAAANLSTSAS